MSLQGSLNFNLSLGLKPIRRRKSQNKKPPEDQSGSSSSGSKNHTISEKSAKTRNAGLDFWNLTLEWNLERVKVPELKEEEIPEAVSSK